MTFTTPTPNPEKRKRGRPRKNATNNINQSSNSKVQNDAMSTINENLQREDVTWEREIENSSTPLDSNIQGLDVIDTQDDLGLEIANNSTPLDANIQELNVIDTQDDLGLEIANNSTPLDANIQGLNVIDTQNELEPEIANNSTPLDANIQGLNVIDTQDDLGLEIANNSTPLDANIQELDAIDTQNDLERETANVGNSAVLLESRADVTANENPEESQLPTSFNDKVSLNKPETSFKLPTTIHIVDGEKGGAGKSFLSRAFIEYCTSIEHNVAIVDADTSNQDIVNIYGSVETAFFSDDDKLAKEADTIFDLAFENSVIVNLPAQVYSKVTKWIKSNNLTEIGKENSIKFVKWFVCTGGVDSVNFFLQSLDDLGDSILHVFVKNLGLCDDWKYIQEMPEFVAAQTKYNFMVMDFPKFPFWERNMVDRLGVTFEAAIAHPDLKVISKQRVKNFLKDAYAAFAGTGLVQ